MCLAGAHKLACGAGGHPQTQAADAKLQLEPDSIMRSLCVQPCVWLCLTWSSVHVCVAGSERSRAGGHG